MSLPLAGKSLSQVLFDLLIKPADLPQLQPGAPAGQSQTAAPSPSLGLTCRYHGTPDFFNSPENTQPVKPRAHLCLTLPPWPPFTLSVLPLHLLQWKSSSVSSNASEQALEWFLWAAAASLCTLTVAAQSP